MIAPWSYRLSRRLPLQNLAAIGFIIFFSGCVLEWILQGKLFGLPPFIWLVVVLAWRWSTKTILQFCRRNAYYGVWLIFLASALVTATYWLLGQQSWKESAIRFVAAIVALIAIVPWMIQKRPDSK